MVPWDVHRCRNGLRRVKFFAGGCPVDAGSKIRIHFCALATSHPHDLPSGSLGKGGIQGWSKGEEGQLSWAGGIPQDARLGTAEESLCTGG